jgi:hypothetical protein
MLLTNQRLDKLAAARVDFQARGMLAGVLSMPVEAAAVPTALPIMVDDKDDDEGEAIDGEVLAEVLLAKKPSMSR